MLTTHLRAHSPAVLTHQINTDTVPLGMWEQNYGTTGGSEFAFKLVTVAKSRSTPATMRWALRGTRPRLRPKQSLMHWWTW